MCHSRKVLEHCNTKRHKRVTESLAQIAPHGLMLMVRMSDVQKYNRSKSLFIINKTGYFNQLCCLLANSTLNLQQQKTHQSKTIKTL